MIFHIDMDAFFASIEIVKNPSLRGKPVIVGGRPDERGVVSTCSYEARKFGVHSAMALTQAKKLCPHGIFLEGSYSLYRKISDQIMEIFHSYTPFVQVMSVDEAYLDISSLLIEQKDPCFLAKEIHKEIFDQTKLTCSIGIAANKMMAKIASSMMKPNGLFYIPKGTEAHFLAPLSIDVIPGIGKKSREYLEENKIYKIRDLQNLSLETLIEKFDRWGYILHKKAFGHGTEILDLTERIPKSIGEETTFPQDTNDLNFLEETLLFSVESIVKRMKGKGMRAARISLKLRDHRFVTFTRARTLFTHSQSLLLLQKEFKDLFLVSYPRKMWVRLIGVTLEKLTDSMWQPTLWNWEEEEIEES